MRARLAPIETPLGSQRFTLKDSFGTRCAGARFDADLLLAATVHSDYAFVAVAGAGFFVFGTQAVMNNFTAASYETRLRSTGVGMAVAFSRLGGVAGPILIGWMQGFENALWLTLAMLAVAQVVAAVVIATLSARSRQTARALVAEPDPMP